MSQQVAFFGCLAFLGGVGLIAALYGIWLIRHDKH